MGETPELPRFPGKGAIRFFSEKEAPEFHFSLVITRQGDIVFYNNFFQQTTATIYLC